MLQLICNLMTVLLFNDYDIFTFEGSFEIT